MEKILILIAIYIASIPLCLLANKWAYKKQDARIIPIVWFIPVVNTMLLIMLCLSLLIALDCVITNSKYWEKRWK